MGAPAMRPGGGRRVLALVALTGAALTLLIAGCAATHPPMAPPAPTGPLPRVALLPLEDLSGRAEAGSVFSRILFVELVRTGACEVIESGVVEAAAESLHIRSAGSLAREDAQDLGRRLDARYLMLGSLLEAGTVRTPGGEVPSVGIALKLLDAATARVVWAAVRFRTGEDKETVFGWGRQHDRQQLAGALAAEVLKGFRIPPADTAATPPPKTLAPPDSTGLGAAPTDTAATTPRRDPR